MKNSDIFYKINSFKYIKYCSSLCLRIKTMHSIVGTGQSSIQLGSPLSVKYAWTKSNVTNKFPKRKCLFFDAKLVAGAEISQSSAFWYGISVIIRWSDKLLSALIIIIWVHIYGNGERLRSVTRDRNTCVYLFTITAIYYISHAIRLRVVPFPSVHWHSWNLNMAQGGKHKRATREV